MRVNSCAAARVLHTCPHPSGLIYTDFNAQLRHNIILWTVVPGGNICAPFCWGNPWDVLYRVGGNLVVLFVAGLVDTGRRARQSFLCQSDRREWRNHSSCLCRKIFLCCTLTLLSANSSFVPIQVLCNTCLYFWNNEFNICIHIWCHSAHVRCY